ncbi:putative receptor-like protein kinase [Dissostichus eleginoides]|uniref:Receptor-like protein kinase n=1 Tax=Dissostichus eleginoides TaxID=100907 RepID=A0AAD9F334_DISEL|nr:putative receptor-like protein kinase [Dissostichus eleginoides]
MFTDRVELVSVCCDEDDMASGSASAAQSPLTEGFASRLEDVKQNSLNTPHSCQVTGHIPAVMYSKDIDTLTKAWLSDQWAVRQSADLQRERLFILLSGGIS